MDIQIYEYDTSRHVRRYVEAFHVDYDAVATITKNRKPELIELKFYGYYFIDGYFMDVNVIDHIEKKLEKPTLDVETLKLDIRHLRDDTKLLVFPVFFHQPRPEY